ncbi:MAG: glycosyltransferase [Campylobacterota bacterium]|nr:glycosyltransferase [Campylobacterota bacterium]
MPKIVFLINSLTHGGSEKVITLLLSALHKEGLNVELVCLERNSIQELDKEIKVTYLSSLNGEESGVVKILWLPVLLIRFLIYLFKNRVHTVQSHIFRANYINLLASRVKRDYKVQIVDVISVDYFQKHGLSGRVNLFLIKHLYNYADTIIFKAQQMRYNLLEFMPISTHTTVINNPYDIKKIETDSREAVTDFIFTPEKQYVVTVGRLSKQKNHIALIDAIKDLHVNTELIIIGEGEEHDTLTKYVASQSLSDRVHLLGSRSNPFKYIRHSDIFVLSSHQEGFPNVLVEAMLCHTAVISTDCISGPREILAPDIEVSALPITTIHESKYGILTPVNDASALNRAITTLLQSPAKREHYSMLAYERAYEFSIDRIASQYKALLCVE